MLSNEFLLILDLSGYSALTDVHGGEAAADIVNRLIIIVNKTLLPDVIIEERIGDEIILSSKNGNSILTTCFDIQKGFESEHNFPSFHAALHFGEIFRKDGGLFSTTINITARMAAYAEPGQVVCSKSFLENIIIPESSKIRSLGEIKFKNILNPIEVFEIDNFNSVIRKKIVDPVCKMTFHINENTLSLEYGNKIYHFCSSKCLGLFENNPEMYL